MALFEKGNSWWKHRATSGRDKVFSTPEQLWQAAVEYFEFTDSRKWTKKDWVGKDAKEVSRESETPYTIAGFCVFVDCSRQWWNEGKKVATPEFLEVYGRIEAIMYTQKFEGAAVGAFNVNIIARDLGLKENIETTVIEQPLFPDLNVHKDDSDK